MDTDSFKVDQSFILEEEIAPSTHTHPQKVHHSNFRHYSIRRTHLTKVTLDLELKERSIENEKQETDHNMEMSL